MTSIYRSEEGHAAARDWCLRRLATVEAPHELRDLDTRLGDTSVTVFEGEAPTVVLLPGTNFNTASWIEVATTLAAQHRVVSVDLPGQPGLSSPQRHRHSYDLYGIWLAKLLEQLAVGPCILVGHSLGARVALAGCVHIPGAKAVVALDPAGIIRLRVGAGMLATSGRWLRRKDDERSRALLAKMMAPGATVPDELVEWMTIVARHVRTTLAPPQLPPARLRQIAIPVHVLSGESDVFLPQRPLRRGARKIRNAKVSWVENAGHLMPMEHPEVVARAVSALV